ncbi:MAG TPA: RidA family protein [Rhodospirillales bacterium]|jgi:enamine deaminase RidA (YjgF/YER057c/UK114 family)|nr:RidA family protein [Rhodospirillales bacterium]HJO69977.1 RidA family protein [Rhodospirillales bacterium]
MEITRQEINPTMSYVVEHNGVVYLAGQMADDQSASTTVQTEQVLAKIDRLLALAGTDKSRLLTAMVFVSDIALRPELNEVWRAWIDPNNPPTRACVGIQLEGPAKVEIIVTAAK